MKNNYKNLQTGIVLSTLILAVFWLAACGDDDSDSGPIPPGQVANFEAEPRNESVKLTWNASIELDLKEYRITYSPGGATPVVIPEGDTEYIVSDLTNETAYTFTIVAVNDTDQESEPAEATATPSLDAAIVPGTFEVTLPTSGDQWRVWEDSTYILRAATGSDDVALSWGASEDAISYKIIGNYPQDTTGAFLDEWEVLKEDISGTEGTVNHDEVGMPGIIYQFKVVAVSEDGSTRESSNYGYLLTRGRPGADVSIGGETYGTVQTGDLTWIDRNLDYDVDIVDFDAGPQDLDHPTKARAQELGDTEAVEKSGRLYSYDAAIAAANDVPGFEVPSDLDLILFEFRLGFPKEDLLSAPNRERGKNTIYSLVVKSENGWWTDPDRDDEFGQGNDEDSSGDNYLGLDFFPGGMSSVNQFTGAYFAWLMMMTSTKYLEEYRGQADQEMIYCHLTWGWNGEEQGNPASNGALLKGAHRDRHPANGITWEPNNPNGRAQRASVRLVSKN